MPAASTSTSEVTWRPSTSPASRCRASRSITERPACASTSPGSSPTRTLPVVPQLVGEPAPGYRVDGGHGRAGDGHGQRRGRQRVGDSRRSRPSRSTSAGRTSDLEAMVGFALPADVSVSGSDQARVIAQHRPRSRDRRRSWPGCSGGARRDYTYRLATLAGQRHPRRLGRRCSTRSTLRRPRRARSPCRPRSGRQPHRSSCTVSRAARATRCWQCRPARSRSPCRANAQPVRRRTTQPVNATLRHRWHPRRRERGPDPQACLRPRSCDRRRICWAGRGAC